ncbi:hypothetical protein PRIPAC_92874 [Pristionchus pacificus]|uniref:Uncharacterized protein n=1 Tax=Pristionchus pacificus TaxID=54126 RepID=A0A2A6BQV9_PRIPA|nr:hypothetical protein PRIPAC_92874 [Pristionchus pacificus]|eukprot:PDM68257.1 hypothetical protein PRIPAC_46301 [Pristionchus pacificus]
MSALLPLLALLPSLAVATPSAFACPFTMMRPPGMPMDPTMGEVCPSRSFLHYYACCEDNLFQCCFYFETWALVFFCILGALIVIGGLIAAARYALMS